MRQIIKFIFALLLGWVVGTFVAGLIVHAEVYLIKVVEGVLSQNDLEADECYASIGQAGMVALRPREPDGTINPSCTRFRELKGKRVEVLLREVE